MTPYLTKNSAATGFMIGLVVAACSSLLLWINQGRSETLVAAVDFLAGFPVFLVRRLDIPQPLFYLFFFTYSGLNGASIARLVRRRCTTTR